MKSRPSVALASLPSTTPTMPTPAKPAVSSVVANNIIINNNNKFKCQHCSKAFQFPYHLKRHLNLLHNPERPKYQCEECGKEYKAEELYRLHCSMAHKLPPPPTAVENSLNQQTLVSSFRGSESSANGNALSLPSTSSFICSSSGESDVEIDVVSVNDCDNVKQSILARSSSEAGSSSQNERSSIESNPSMSSSVFEKSTATATAANASLPVPSPMTYSCETCGSRFKQRHYLQQHMITHSQQRPFTCQICNKGFSRASTLFAHRNVHSAGRQFQCLVCLKAFKHKRSLNEHIKSKICYQGEFHPQLVAKSSKQSSPSSSKQQQQQQQQQQQGSISSSSSSNNKPHPVVNSPSNAVSLIFSCDICENRFQSVSYLYMHKRRCHRNK